VVKGDSQVVRLYAQGQEVAVHPRIWEKEKVRFEPVHYLALLERKRQAGYRGTSTALELGWLRYFVCGFHRLGTKSLTSWLVMEGKRLNTSVRYSWGLMARRRQL